MNSFNFDDRQVEICGKVYTIDFDQPNMSAYADKVQAELEKMKDGGNLTKRAIDAFRKFIDLLLGDGAFDEIFATQPVTMTSLSKLLVFLGGECAEEVRVYKRTDVSDVMEYIDASKNKNT